jgi:hypothetical protein
MGLGQNMTLVPHLRYRSIALAAAGLALAWAGVALAWVGLALGWPGVARAAADYTNGSVVYRWTDDNGVVHYGDRVPPQYAKKETTVLNDEGIVVGELSAEKTPAQLAEAAREQQQEQLQKQRDTFLLTTYSSARDIAQLRDERIDQLKGQLVASQQYIESLHERLLALQARAMLFKPYNPEPSARRLPDDLTEQIVLTINEMRLQHKEVDAKDHEEADIRAQFQTEIDRYCELNKSASGCGAQP